MVRRLNDHKMVNWWIVNFSIHTFQFSWLLTPHSQPFALSWLVSWWLQMPPRPHRLLEALWHHLKISSTVLKKFSEIRILLSSWLRLELELDSTAHLLRLENKCYALGDIQTWVANTMTKCSSLLIYHQIPYFFNFAPIGVWGSWRILSLNSSDLICDLLRRF